MAKTRSGFLTSDKPAKNVKHRPKKNRWRRPRAVMWLLGKPGNFKGTQLPTKRQTLLNFMAFKAHKARYNDNVSNISSLVYDDVASFWARSGIPTVGKQLAVRRITRLYRNYEGLLKGKSRKTETERKKRRDFEAQLDKLFDIAAPDADLDIRRDRLRTQQDKEDDITNFKDQRSTRRGHMEGLDKVYERKQSRNSGRKKRKREERNQQPSPSGLPPAADSISSDSRSGDENCSSDFNGADLEDVEFEPLTNPRSKVTRQAFNSQTITSLADRFGVSNNASSALTLAVLKEMDTDLSQATVSPSTFRRSRIKNSMVAAEESRGEFDANRSDHGVIQWDGKLMQTTTSEKTERLAIIFSDLDEYKEGKVLGVPELDNSTGETQAKKTAEMIDKWGLRSVVQAMVFDTTSSNTPAIPLLV